ncbi:hypothetical protein EVAR_42008_1 [Eumeta japonica]|uniref:Uncharacterized protein n=1 Tax=Eumeta variegata TaxID=151549 RepID=A0A4C1WPR7_EUMVA|nr:hypothetical protein EVAR_42008_1 [Eumeta japonica]
MSRIKYGLEVDLALLTRKKYCKRSQMIQVFPFVELKKEWEYPKAQHIVFYKEPKCIRFTYNEFKVFSVEIILKGFNFVEQCYRGACSKISDRVSMAKRTSPVLSLFRLVAHRRWLPTLLDSHHTTDSSGQLIQ